MAMCTEVGLFAKPTEISSAHCTLNFSCTNARTGVISKGWTRRMMIPSARISSTSGSSGGSFKSETSISGMAVSFLIRLFAPSLARSVFYSLIARVPTEAPVEVVVAELDDHRAPVRAGIGILAGEQVGDEGVHFLEAERIAGFHGHFARGSDQDLLGRDHQL